MAVMLSSYDLLTVLFVLVALVSHVMLAIRAGSVSQGLMTLRTLWWRVRSAVSWRRGSPKETQTRKGLIVQTVSNLIMLRRVKLCTSLLIPCSLWCGVVCIQGFLNVMTGQERFVTTAGDLIFWVFYTTVQLLRWRPSWITPSSIDLWCTILVFLGVLVLSPLAFHDMDRVLIVSLGCGALRLCFGLCVRMSVCVLWNVAWLATLSLHFLQSPQPECNCAPLVFHGPTVLAAEASACLAVVLTSSVVRSFMEGEARQQVEATTSRTGLEASKSLLATICDAVVELDADLRFSEPSPSFATLLLNASPPPIGARLDQFAYSDDDRHRFGRYMQVPVHEAGAIADAFHVKMRDSAGSAVNMELFHVCFMDNLTGLPQHLVGLREHSDLGMPNMPSRPHGIEQEQLDFRELEMALVFDAVSFDVLDCSLAFASRFGPCAADTSLLDWLKPEEPQLKAFCDKVNDFAVNSEDAVCFFELQPLVLRLPGSDQVQGPKLSRRVAFMLSRGGPEDAEWVLAKMVLSNSRSPGSRGSSNSSPRRKAGRTETAGRGTPAVLGHRQWIGDLEWPRAIEEGVHSRGAPRQDEE